MRLLHECPHNYMNKISGVEQPTNEHMTAGKIGHGIIQRHVSGVEIREDLSHIKFTFPIVEKTDFDPDCKFEVLFEGHTIFGFVDGLDPKNKRTLEIKLSYNPWSLQKFKDSPQRKIYGWALNAWNMTTCGITGNYEEAILITGDTNPDQWKYRQIKVARVPFTKQDYREAEEYITKSFDIIKSGDFLTDLVDGKCVDPRCYWGERCMYK